MSAAASAGGPGPGPGPASPSRPTVTVLGASGSYPGPGAACSGYLLRHLGFNLWLDAGPGTMANLQTHIGLGEVDAIVLSHQHPDHWSDLEGFFVACRYIEERTNVPIYAPAGLRSLMRSGPDTHSTLAWHDVTDGTVTPIGPFVFTFARTDHPPETLAMRIDATTADGTPVALGYSADTGPGWSLSALGQGLDLAICEATFLHDREGTSPHLSARQAGATARAAGAARLLITHIWPIVDPAASAAEASAAFGAPVVCAQMNATYSL